jgi:DNA repair protein RecN (Recombination protein N)
VGNLLKQLAIKHQVIAITHLPQIAAKGNHHFHVYKEVSNHKTTSLIKELKEQHRVSEIARMLAGDNFSESALTSAGELLKA